MNPDTDDQQASLDDELKSALESVEEVDIDETPKAEAEAEAPEVEAAPEGETVEEAIERLSAPARWNKEAKEAFDSWANVEGGTAYQKAMLEQYGQTQSYLTQKEQEAAQYRQQTEQWNGLIEPVRQQLQMRGVRPEQFVEQLIGHYQALNSDPQSTIEFLAKQYNVDLGQIGQDAPYQSPTEAALQQRLDQLERAHRHNLVQAQQQEVQRANQQVQSFANETDASGELKHPHISQVGNKMAKLLQAGLAEDLPDAYEKACKMSIEVSSQVQAQRLQQDTARKAENAKKAQEAARRPKGKHIGEVTESISIDDELSDLIEQSAA